MIYQKLLFWAFLVAAIGAGALWLFVLGDLLRYRDLQRRLKAEREDPHEEGEDSND